MMRFAGPSLKTGLASLACFLVLGGVATAYAQGARRYPEQTADFWREVKSPGYARSRTLLRHGVERLAHAVRELISDPQQPEVGRAYVDGALVRLHLAHARAPKDPEALYILAMARIMWRGPGDGGSPMVDDDETMALLQQLRRLDPEYEAARVAFEMGILYTREHRFDLAAAEYERCLSRILLPTEGEPAFRTPEDVLADRLFGAVTAPTVHYDLGDVTVQLGNLQKAIAQYQRAIDEGTRSNQEFQTVLLAHWGLAAALDRFGEHDAAMEHVDDALRLDDSPMAVLHLPSVFFEPAYEIHYYQALGHMALADKASTDSGKATQTQERKTELTKAADEWELYLSQGGNRSPWADLARQHLGEVRKALAALHAP